MKKLMLQILRNITWPWGEALAPLRRWICSIGLLLVLGSCHGAPKFPTQTLWEVDLKNGICGEYEIVDSEKFIFKAVKDWPISKCDGVFGFSSEDTPKVLNWGEEMQTYSKAHCAPKIQSEMDLKDFRASGTLK